MPAPKLRAVVGKLTVIAILSFSLGCSADAPTGAAPSTVFAVSNLIASTTSLIQVQEATPHPVIDSVASVMIYGGGYGSAAFPAPGKPGYLYMLTDRGPNFDFKGGKAFPIPDFTPQIGLFKLTNGTLARSKVITLKDTSGNPLTGLPIPAGPGSTGELAYTVNGDLIPLDPNGIDSEGLVVAPDGSFWISDEYGPFFVHVDATGRTLGRFGPFGGTKSLPKVLAKRRANRGMEGLGILPDGVTLVGAMQSPVDGNPTRPSSSQPTFTRILFYNTVTGATRQLLYPIERGDRLVSEIVSLTDTTFLVLERDGNFPGYIAHAIKRVVKININGATDVNTADPLNDTDGYNLLSGTGAGKTIEGATAAQVLAAGVIPVSKVTIIDVIDSAPDYAHDKAEGIAVLDRHTIAVVNDDDFGVTDGLGGLVQKILPLTGKVDRNKIYVFRVEQALY